MEVSRWSACPITVLELAGRLTAGREIELAALRRTIRDLINARRLDVAVDLSGLTQVDARGLGELATMIKAMRDVGGRLCLTAASPRVARMLAVTRLDTALEWCDEAEMAATA